MRNQKERRQNLEQLSRELARYFLSIHGYGVIIPKRILLYGCPNEVMTLMANIMKEELTGREDVTVSILSRCNGPFVDGEGYYIDVAYFVGGACRAETSSLNQETWQSLTLSQTNELDDFSRDGHRTDRSARGQVLASASWLVEN
jgi:hypothetical protein